MAAPLQNWLKARRKVKVLELMVEHSNKALEVTDEFLLAEKAALEGNIKERDAAFRRGTVREREGDALRRKTEEELAKGELSPEERGYLMSLAKHIDGVANYAHGASRILTFIPADRFDEPMKNEVRVMGSKVRDCVASMARCMRALSEGDVAGAEKGAGMVEELEEEVDELHMNSRRILMGGFYDGSDPRVIVFSSELLEAIEETSDRCEDVSDQVRVLLVYLSQPSE
jgi:predicted phosphate transport protein (TIGR00153 family)